MSTITKEQAKDLRNAFDCWQQDYDPVEDKEQYDMFGLGMVAMDALLASLEAEPVGEVVVGDYDDSGCHPDARVVCIAADGQADWENFKDGTRLYTTPPAPVSVPDEAYSDDCPDLYPSQPDAWAAGWNACRAAMLQGAEPVTTAYKLPVEVSDAINRLLDSDGCRGRFSAIECHEAREELERLLAAAPQQEVKS